MPNLAVTHLAVFLKHERTFLSNSSLTVFRKHVYKVLISDLFGSILAVFERCKRHYNHPQTFQWNLYVKWFRFEMMWSSQQRNALLAISPATMEVLLAVLGVGECLSGGGDGEDWDSEAPDRKRC